MNTVISFEARIYKLSYTQLFVPCFGMLKTMLHTSDCEDSLMCAVFTVTIKGILKMCG
jgi:hypothetical protein